jgi:NitT/TauT family transport system ATP-binding protein
MGLQVERITKSFESDDGRLARRQILEDFSLGLEDHEFVSVLGPSGCGKTTLLRLVAGFDLPDSGEIIFDGAPVTGPAPDRVVVFQQAGLLPWLDVRHNVAFGLRLKKRRIDWAPVDEILEIVGLKDFARHAPHELSGGMQQRVALARSLVMRPKMLLMDEPFAALDAHLRHAMQEFLLDLWKEIRTTVLFITHDIEEAIVLGERVVVLGSSPGRILGELDSRDIRPSQLDLLDNADYRALRHRAVTYLSEATEP